MVVMLSDAWDDPAISGSSHLSSPKICRVEDGISPPQQPLLWALLALLRRQTRPDCRQLAIHAGSGGNRERRHSASSSTRRPDQVRPRGPEDDGTREEKKPISLGDTLHSMPMDLECETAGVPTARLVRAVLPPYGRTTAVFGVCRVPSGRCTNVTSMPGISQSCPLPGLRVPRRPWPERFHGRHRWSGAWTECSDPIPDMAW